MATGRNFRLPERNGSASQGRGAAREGDDMARWMVFFEDSEEMAQVRAENSEAHLAYLDKNRDRILIAGGLRPQPNGHYVGALWIIEAPSKAEVIDLIEADPYYRYQYRRYRLFAWGKAFAERPVVL